MNTDTLGRRDRYKPRPDNNNRVVTEADIKIIHYNHLHGGVGLPTSYLFNAGTHGYYNSFEKRMTILRHDLRLLDTGIWQKRTENPRANCLINTNTKKAEELLKEHGLWSPHVPKKSGAHFHDAYMSAVIGSFSVGEISHQTEVMKAAGLTDTLFKLNDVSMRPDAVFMVKYQGRDVLIFLEADRATEPVRSMSSTRISWQPKINFYRKMIGGGEYKKIFKVDCGALLLISTVSPYNTKNILSLVQQTFKGSCNYMLAQSRPEFGFDFKPGKKLLDVYTSDWHRCGHPAFIFTPK